MSYRELYRRVVERLLKHIKACYRKRLVSVAVFGSVGRGRFSPESDIDLLIVAEDLPRGRRKRIEEFIVAVETPLEKELQKEGLKHIPEISLLIKTPDEVKQGSPVFLDLVSDALILYDRDDFLKKYLEELKKKLLKLGAKKIFRGGGWYWILKPDYKPGDTIEL